MAWLIWYLLPCLVFSAVGSTYECSSKGVLKGKVQPAPAMPKRLFCALQPLHRVAIHQNSI
jgi:hypothetical protein